MRGVWNVTLTVLFAFDVVLLSIARPIHQAVFEGELGLIELPTFFILVLTALVSARAAAKQTGAARTFFAVLALGCFYWAGEEVSWGQTFLHWGTPAGYARGNYQKETNLHNERGIVGTLLNQTPRLILTVSCIVAIVMALPWTTRLREAFVKRFGACWLTPLPWCIGPAALAMAASTINKLRPLDYRDFGETEELYIALFLLAFVWVSGRKEGAVVGGGESLARE